MIGVANNDNNYYNYNYENYYMIVHINLKIIGELNYEK